MHINYWSKDLLSVAESSRSREHAKKECKYLCMEIKSGKGRSMKSFHFIYILQQAEKSFQQRFTTTRGDRFGFLIGCLSEMPLLKKQHFSAFKRRNGSKLSWRVLGCGKFREKFVVQLLSRCSENLGRENIITS